MTLKKSAAFGLRGMSPAERAMGRFMRSPDGHDNGGSTGGGTTKNEPPKDEGQQQQENQNGDAAELERLRTALADAQTAAKKYEGIDPAVAKENARKVADAEAAAREAEKKQAEAEGNFERLRELQNEEHEAALAALRAERDEARQELTNARTEAQKAKVTSAFAASTFFGKETILTAAKAEKLYGDHVEIENGVTVVYDAPKDAAKRTKIMDSRGNAIPFDAAMQKIVEADPDKDNLLRSKIVPGGNTKTVQNDSKTQAAQSADRLGRLAAGLGKLRSEK